MSYGSWQDERRRKQDELLTRLGYLAELWLADIIVEEAMRDSIDDEVLDMSDWGESGEVKAEYLFRRLNEKA